MVTQGHSFFICHVQKVKHVQRLITHCMHKIKIAFMHEGTIFNGMRLLILWGVNKLKNSVRTFTICSQSHMKHNFGLKMSAVTQLKINLSIYQNLPKIAYSSLQNYRWKQILWSLLTRMLFYEITCALLQICV